MCQVCQTSVFSSTTVSPKCNSCWSTYAGTKSLSKLTQLHSRAQANTNQQYYTQKYLLHKYYAIRNLITFLNALVMYSNRLCLVPIVIGALHHLLALDKPLNKDKPLNRDQQRNRVTELVVTRPACSQPLRVRSDQRRFRCTCGQVTNLL